MAAIDHAAWTRTRAADSWCRCCPVCTDSSTDTVANRSSPWLRLITLLGLGLVLQTLGVAVVLCVQTALLILWRTALFHGCDWSRCLDSDSCCGDCWCRCCPVCTDSSTDTVANTSSPWLRLITLFGLGLVKPSTFTESQEDGKPGRTFMSSISGQHACSVNTRITFASKALRFTVVIRSCSWPCSFVNLAFFVTSQELFFNSVYQTRTWGRLLHGKAFVFCPLCMQQEEECNFVCADQYGGIMENQCLVHWFSTSVVHCSTVRYSTYILWYP
jgi:hypothetical protein